VRIGTWNLAGRWTPAHESLLQAVDCDVLLLTEVSEGLELPGYHAHLSTSQMAQRRRWAGVFSRAPLTALPDPHPASAAALIDGLTFCSSILPWRSCGTGDVWVEGNHAAKTEHAVNCLLTALPTSGLVWGGDFNHAMQGREWTGSIAGRSSITAALAKLNLQVPTARLPHQIDGLLSIDHIAVPEDSLVGEAERVSARLDTGRLSDHDAYVVHVG
jgi:endonuclease/exonuclease/phosphatase family metal-dependent hydrolase